MFCGNCGQSMDAGKNFCSSCGEKLDAGQAKEKPTAAEDDLETAAQRPSKKSKVIKLWKIAAISAITFIAVIVSVLVFGNREISKVDGLKTQTSLSSFVDGTAGGATDFELRTHDECPADEKVTEFIASSESWYKNSISGQSYSFFQEVFATASEDSAKELASIFSEFTSFCDTETVSEGKYVLSKTTFGDFGTIRDVFGLDLEGVVLDFKHCDNMSTCWGDGQFADARVVLAYRGKVAMLIHYSVDSSGYPVKPSPMSFDQIDRLALSALEDFDG
jgi:hypothetical protein